MTKRSEAAEKRREASKFKRRRQILERLYRYADQRKIPIIRPIPPTVGRRPQRRLRRNRICFLGSTVFSTMHENVGSGSFCRPLVCGRCHNGFTNRHRQTNIVALDRGRFARLNACPDIVDTLLPVPFKLERSPALLQIPEDQNQMEHIELVKYLDLTEPEPVARELGDIPMPIQEINESTVPMAHQDWGLLHMLHWTVRTAANSMQAFCVPALNVCTAINDELIHGQRVIPMEGRIYYVVLGTAEGQWEIPTVRLNGQWLFSGAPNDAVMNLGFRCGEAVAPPRRIFHIDQEMVVNISAVEREIIATAPPIPAALDPTVFEDPIPDDDIDDFVEFDIEPPDDPF